MFMIGLKSRSISPTRLTSQISSMQQRVACRGREDSIVSRESMSSMMSDECQGMCSIDMSLCSLVFVRIFMLSDQGLLIHRRRGLKDCIVHNIRRTEKRTEIYAEREEWLFGIKNGRGRERAAEVVEEKWISLEMNWQQKYIPGACLSSL